MTDFSTITKDEIPFHIQKGTNLWRILAIFLLTALISLSIYSIEYVGYVMIAVIISCLFGLICIRFPRINLYTDRFEIVRKGIFKRFSDRNVFSYKDLIKVEFSPGITDWNYLIVLSLFGSGGFGGNSKADQLIISTIYNRTFIFNRFGNQTSFIKTIELINMKIKPCN